jgi:gliding motility-associated-like protein
VKNCIDYAGLEIGTDTACIKVCDVKGICHEFKMYVTVIPANFKEVVYDTIYVGQTKDTCINYKSLKSTQTTMVNNFVNQQLNADFKLDNIKHCVKYTGVNIGNDTAVVTLCDKFNNCDEVTYYIHVRFPGPDARNDYDTVAVTQTVLIHEMENDSIPGGLKSMHLISSPRWGTLQTMPNKNIMYVATDEPCPAIDTFRYAICNVAGCDTATVYIYIRCINVHVSNGFSPNGDGVNDAFHINDIELFPDSDLRIFNRWGNMVYNTIGYKNNWTGTWNESTALPDGTYFYCVDLHDKDKTVLSGYIQIQR